MKDNTEYRIFQVPGYITKMTTMSGGSVRLQIDTQEGLKPESVSTLMNYLNQLGWFTFNVHQIETKDIIDLPPIKKIDKRSKSQILREELFKAWRRNDRGIEDSEEYYNYMMDEFIKRVEKLT